MTQYFPLFLANAFAHLLLDLFVFKGRCILVVSKIALYNKTNNEDVKVYSSSHVIQ